MNRPLKYILIGLVVLFVVITFLNCGREANAMPRKERVHRNKIDDRELNVSHQQIRIPQSVQATDCERVDASYEFINYLNNRLFAYTLIGRWCFDGTDVVWHRWSDEFHIGDYWWSNWQWEGAQDPIDTGGDGRHYAFRRIKGKFGVNILWYHRSVTPYVQCTVRGDGTERCGKGD
jgi:hypothetical protein